MNRIPILGGVLMKMAEIVHEDDKQDMQDIVVDSIQLLVNEGFEIEVAAEFVGAIVVATRDNYGD